MLIAIICLFTGFTLGFFTAALCQAASHSDSDRKNNGLSLFGVGEWVGGGGGAGRVVWGYGYHVVVHRRPATA